MTKLLTKLGSQSPGKSVQKSVLLSGEARDPTSPQEGRTNGFSARILCAPFMAM